MDEGKEKEKEEGGGVLRGIKGRREGDRSRVREEGNGWEEGSNVFTQQTDTHSLQR